MTIRRRRTTTPESAETRADVEAAQNHHARALALAALAVLTPNVA